MVNRSAEALLRVIDASGESLDLGFDDFNSRLGPGFTVSTLPL